MSKPINEQVVIITGAGRGLGAAIAKSFVREGAKVAVNYRRSEVSAQNLVKELVEYYPEMQQSIIAVQADVTDTDSVKSMVNTVVEKLGKPTTIIHNALADYSFNGDARGSIESLSKEAFLDQHSTAVLGALNMIQACTPIMDHLGFGRIVTIGTNLFQNPVVPYHDYISAKGALLGLTRTAANELGKKGITVNMVSGGLLRTTDASAATPDAVFDFIAQSTPLGSVTTPEELADVVLFFASPWARAVTGQNLIVDGGLVYS